MAKSESLNVVVLHPRLSSVCDFTLAEAPSFEKVNANGASNLPAFADPLLPILPPPLSQQGGVADLWPQLLVGRVADGTFVFTVVPSSLCCPTAVLAKGPWEEVAGPGTFGIHATPNHTIRIPLYQTCSAGIRLTKRPLEDVLRVAETVLTSDFLIVMGQAVAQAVAIAMRDVPASVAGAYFLNVGIVAAADQADASVSSAGVRLSVSSFHAGAVNQQKQGVMHVAAYLDSVNNSAQARPGYDYYAGYDAYPVKASRMRLRIFKDHSCEPVEDSEHKRCEAMMLSTLRWALLKTLSQWALIPREPSPPAQNLPSEPSQQLVALAEEIARNATGVIVLDPIKQPLPPPSGSERLNVLSKEIMANSTGAIVFDPLKCNTINIIINRHYGSAATAAERKGKDKGSR